MGNKKKGGLFLKQAAILAAAGLLARFLGFLYRPALTSLIGDEGNAIYSAGYYIYTFLLILSSAGLPAAISRMVSERIAIKEYRNAHKVFTVSLLVSSVLGLVSMVVLFLFAKPIAEMVESPESYYSLLTLAPTLFIVAVMSAYRGYFQGMNTMVPTAVSQVIEQIFNAFFSVYLAWVFIKQGVAMGAAGGTAGTGIGALAGLVIVIFSYMMIRPTLLKRMRKEGNNHYAESSGEITKILLGTAIPIIIGTAVFSITNLIDMKMVMSRLLASGAFDRQAAKVLYGQLSGKYVVLTTLPVSISTAMATAAIPSIAASVKLKEKENVKRKMNLSIRLAMIISIPAAVGIGVLGDQILLLLFPDYPAGGILLKVGAVSIVFLALCQIVTGMLQGIGKVSVPVIGALFGAVTKIILNYVLISNPKINVVGAVISTTGCYLVASVVNMVMLSKYTRVKPDIMGALVKPAFASALMGVGCYSAYHLIYLALPKAASGGLKNTIATLLAIVISMALYGIILLLIKGLTEEEIKMFPAGGKMLVYLKKYNFI